VARAWCSRRCAGPHANLTPTLTPPDVPPPPGRIAAQAFERYLRRLAARHFAAVHWGGEVPGSGFRVPGLDLGTRNSELGSVLFVANHTNWWDGFLACLVSARLGLHFQILMEARHLERYWMFRWVGALPMRRDSTRGAYQDLERAALVLRRPATGLWIFPQGERRPPEEPVTDTERGAAQLVIGAEGPVTLWPVGFRYRYLGEQIPEAFVWLGDPVTMQADETLGVARLRRRRELADEIECRLTQTVDALDRRLATEDLRDFTVLVLGRRSVNKRLDRVRHALGFLRGPFDDRNG
jgi:1-acyl-sn-glycerol-3-phosphate acyltransferase